MDLLANMSDKEVIEFIKNIDSKKLCYLMMGFSEPDRERIYSQLSDRAKSIISEDIEKLSSLTQDLQ